MKKTLVIGLGMSGRAVVHLLLAQKKAVIGLDKNKELLNSDPVLRLKEKGVLIVDDLTDLADVNQVILSSGIRPVHPIAQKALDLGIEVLGEAAFCLRFSPQKCIGITGTNGKTTVALMVKHILIESNIPARAVGNIGIPLADYFLSMHDSKEVIVVELSSYQLETLESPIFDTAIILNITPDHLDQYASMSDYIQAKCRLQKCMKPSGIFYVHDHINRDMGAMGLSFLEGMVETFLPVSYRNLGRHDIENAFAAWALVKHFGVTQTQFAKALDTFKKPPHRIEFVKEIEGVSYFDDSKGTNLDAVIRAVNAMNGQVVLIAGGVDKGSSYTQWIEPFKDKVKGILAIGQAAPKIINELEKFFNIERCSTLEEAVKTASQRASQGDCVLLSPGCASFDMFRDYAHRGEEFKRCVENLRR